MKKVLLMMIAIVLTAGTAMAQIPTERGNAFVNAHTSDFNLSFGNGTRFSLGANAGYFVFNNFAVLGGLGVSATKYKENGIEFKTNSFNVNVGARFYFAEQNNGKFFASGLFGVDKAKGRDATASLTFNAGYALFLNEHVALEPLVNLWIPFSDGYDVRFSLGAGISVYF